MRCDEFQERLHDCLDAGQRPGADRPLRRHCRQCTRCRQDLHAWQAIDRVVAPPARRSPAGRPALAVPRWAVAALLAGVLFGLNGWSGPDIRWASRGGPPATPQANRNAAVSPSSIAASQPGAGVADHRLAVFFASEQDLLQWDDPRWQDPAWIDRWADQVAEPLEPLSQGFAPLGRSFQAAFSLLLLPRQAGEAKPPPLGQSLQSGQPVRGLDRNYV